MKSGPPLLGLLVRSVIWTPVALLIGLSLLLAFLGFDGLPMVAGVFFLAGLWMHGAICLAAAIPFYLVYRVLSRRFWEEPESLL